MLSRGWQGGPDRAGFQALFVCKIRGLDVDFCFLASAMFCLGDASKHARGPASQPASVSVSLLKDPARMAVAFLLTCTLYSIASFVLRCRCLKPTSLYTVAESNLGDRVLEVEKIALLLGQEQRTQQANAPQNQVSQLVVKIVTSFIIIASKRA